MGSVGRALLVASKALVSALEGVVAVHEHGRVRRMDGNIAKQAVSSCGAKAEGVAIGVAEPAGEAGGVAGRPGMRLAAVAAHPNDFMERNHRMMFLNKKFPKGSKGKATDKFSYPLTN